MRKIQQRNRNYWSHVVALRVGSPLWSGQDFLYREPKASVKVSSVPGQVNCEDLSLTFFRPPFYFSYLSYIICTHIPQIWPALIKP